MFRVLRSSVSQMWVSMRAIDSMVGPILVLTLNLLRYFARRDTLSMAWNSLKAARNDRKWGNQAEGGTWATSCF
jgi:hypothetical protein